MQITVLSHMPFGGKQRKPGEILSEDIWLAASETARSALVNQGMVRVTDGGEAGEGSADMIELLQGISAKLDRLLTKEGVAAVAAPKAAPRKRTRRKATKAKA